MNNSFAEQLEAARRSIEGFLDRPEVIALAERAAMAGLTRQQAAVLLDAKVRLRPLPPALEQAWRQLAGEQALLVRWMMALAAQRSLDLLPGAAVTEDVREMTLRGCAAVADARLVRDEWLLAGGPEFRQYAEVALLRRFIAGHVHWTVSGIPRSWLLRMSWRDAFRCLAAMRRMGGREPCFEAHVPATPLLMQREYERAYRRIAASMELQPAIRGLIGSSWLHAEETMKISPHLEWINRLFLDHGGVLLHLGEAAPDSGFLAGSQRRKELYASGAYRPRIAMFIWPRNELLQWARSLPPA